MFNLSALHSIQMKKWEMVLLSAFIALLPPLAQAITTGAINNGLISTTTASIIMGLVNFLFLNNKSVVSAQ